MLVSEGNDFEHAVAAVMYLARSLVLVANNTTAEWDAELKALTNDVKPEWLENWYDGLGYCTNKSAVLKWVIQNLVDTFQVLGTLLVKS